MPLTMVRPGECGLIKKVGGKAETRLFLENLGFLPGIFGVGDARIGGNVTLRQGRPGGGKQRYGPPRSWYKRDIPRR